MLQYSTLCKYDHILGGRTMKKIKKHILAIIIPVLVISFLSGCSSSPYEKQIIGKWTIESLEFVSDGNDMLSYLQNMLYNMVFEPGSEIEFINKEKVSILGNSSNYKWIEKDKLQIGDDGEGDDAPVVFDVEIEKGSMTWKNQILTVHLKAAN
jgi:hypothetical protein